MAVAQPGAVEAKPLAQFDDLQCRFVPCSRVRRVEQANREESKLA
jgi:hypothetical protein